MSAAAVPILSTDWLTWMITRQERIADGNLHNNFFLVVCVIWFAMKVRNRVKESDEASIG